MQTRHFLSTAVLALAAALPAHAADLATDGTWAAFSVDELSSTSGGLEWIDIDTGLPLAFSFTIDAGYYGVLTVVDAGLFAGDRFTVSSGDTLLGETSPAVQSAPDVGLDFDAALGNADYSRGSFVFNAGSWNVTGTLSDSALYDGFPLNATAGGVRLAVSPVPEPAAVGLLLAGLGIVSVAATRRRTR